MKRIFCTVALLLTGCACASTTSTDLEFLTRGECVNTPAMRANLDEALRSMGRAVVYRVVDLDAVGKTDPRYGYPTPTLLVGGHDLLGLPVPVPPFPEPA